LNCPLVESICCGLCEGFWPFENFDDSAPDTWDKLTCLLEGSNLEFALKQCDEEIKEERFSPAFGPDLLPGMYSIPIRVVPKPYPLDLHLVTEHSTGEHTLNSFITCTNSSIKLDGLQDFGSTLHTILSRHGHPPAWLFKSDMSAIY